MNSADYVLQILYQSREEVIAHPEWFEPDAPKRLDKAILYYTEETKPADARQAA